MQSPFCKPCGTQMELSATGIYYCLDCGFAYSYSWSMSDGVHVETVICRYTLPDNAEYRHRLAVLKERERMFQQQLRGLGFLCGFGKKKALRAEQSLLQKRIHAIETYLLSRQSD